MRDSIQAVMMHMHMHMPPAADTLYTAGSPSIAKFNVFPNQANKVLPLGLAEGFGSAANTADLARPGSTVPVSPTPSRYLDLVKANR